MKLTLSLFLWICGSCTLIFGQSDQASQAIKNDKVLDSLKQVARQSLAISDSGKYLEARAGMVEYLLQKGSYNEALTISDTIADPVMRYFSAQRLERYIDKLTRAYVKNRDIERAIAEYQRAIMLISGKSDNDWIWLRAKLLAKQAGFYRNQRDYDLCERAFDRSIELYYQLPPALVANELQSTARKFATYLSGRGNRTKALTVLSRLEKIVLEHLPDDKYLHIDLYTEMGSMFNFSFGLGKSSDYYLKAKALLDNLPDSQRKIGNYYILAFNMANRKDYTNSAIYAKKGIEMAKRIIGEESAWVVSGKYTLCIALLQSGQIDLAEEVANEALAICEKTGLTPSLTGIQMLMAMGTIQYQKKDYDKAIQYLLRGEKYVQNKPRRTVEWAYSSTGNTLGLSFLKTNQVDSALSRFHKSLTFMANNFDNPDVLATPQNMSYKSMDFAFSALSGKSLSLERKFDQTGDAKYLFASFASIMAADTLITNTKKLSSSMNDQLGPRPKIAKLIRAGIRVSHKLYLLTKDNQYLEAAFHFSEAAKSGLILSNLQESLALDMTKVPESLLAANDNTLKDISYYEQKLYKAKKAKDSVEINRLSIVLSPLRLKADSIQRVINGLNPNYFAVKFSNEYETIASLQQTLDKRQLVLNYASGDSCVFIFKITKDEASLQRKTLDSDFKNQVDQFIQQLRNPRLNSFKAKDYLALSEKIREALIPPSIDTGDIGKITIIPENYLSLIPFEALVTSAQNPISGYSSLKYFIEEYCISYANSATLLARQEKAVSRFKSSQVLAFAPIFDQNSAAAVPETDISRSSLSPLTWTDYEVKQISKYFETKQLLASEANESNFRSAAGDYSIIHIASHGLSDPDNTRYSKLVFSPFKTDSVNDGFLNTQELYAMKIPAEMVVLSACNTAIGDIISGEGVISLAHGFFYAGSKSLVMSLWTANDQSTASIIGDFYAELANGEDKGTALRNAKLNYLESADDLRSHPYYWAHMVVNGNNRAFKVKTNWWPHILLTLVVISLIITLALKKKRETLNEA